MDPVQDLKNEHRAVESALMILESMAADIAGSPDGRPDTTPVLINDAQSMLDFLRTFVDTCHHGKEEQILFPALEYIGVSRKNGPIGVMLSEHDLGRSHIRGMAKALDALAAGDPEAGDRFREHALAYIHLLREHIAKEELVLFNIADQRLSLWAKATTQEAFDRIEREKIGQGRHESFHRLLDDLTEKYMVRA